MPALLSPRSDMAPEPKKSKGSVMRRLQSTITTKLGRKKAPTDHDIRAVDSKMAEPAHVAAKPAPELNAVAEEVAQDWSPSIRKETVIKPFNAQEDEEEERDEQQISEETADDEVFASDYRSGQPDEAPEEYQEAFEDDDEDKLEVFPEPNSAVEERSNQGPGHGALDLAIVGQSPAKLRFASLSPPKKSMSNMLDPLPEEKPQAKSPFAGSPMKRSSRVGSGAAALGLSPSSPLVRSARAESGTMFPKAQAPQQPLLSDFQFGGEPAVERPHSPVKRREPPSRKVSVTRDDEDDAMQSFQPHPAPSEPVEQPIVVDAFPPRPTSPPVKQRASLGPTASRRRSSNMAEAPILASSFHVQEPERHEDQASGLSTALEDRIEEEDDIREQQQEDDQSSAFVFDAGAAITKEFGDRVARLLGADPWGDRQDGFDSIQFIVKKADLSSLTNKRELLCAVFAAVQCGVDDRVAPVMYCSLECLRAVLKEFAPVLDRSFVKYPPMNETLSALIKSLVGKLGDSNKRTQRETSQAVIRLAKLRKLKALPHILLHLSAKEVPPRVLVEALQQLVKELGVQANTPSALNVEVVMQFAVPALKIADEKTRKAAVELIASLHMISGQAVNAQLVGIKPEMLRVITRRIDELVAKREQERAEEQQSKTNQSEEINEDAQALDLLPVLSEDSKVMTQLLEVQLHNAATVVGPVSWRKLESKTWSDRKEAIVDIEKTIADAKSDLRDMKPAFGSIIQHNFLAYCVVVHKCLVDSIAPVVNSAMDCFATLIKVFGPYVEWREDSVREVVLLTIMRLFGTMQKPNNRTNRAACRSVLKLARLNNAHTLRYTLSCIFAKDTDPIVQMHLLRLLIPEFGFQPDGISANMVLTAVTTALVHANDKVRKIAIDVALCTQRLVGKEYVLSKLKDVKAVTLKELEKNFVECEVKKDGDRPQTVHAAGPSTSAADAGMLPPVTFGSSGEQSRRLLNSAPVGVGKLHCSPSDADEYSSSHRRASVLSNEEESLMDSILDGGDL